MAFTKQQPSYTRYANINKNVEGVNWEEVNKTRKELGNEPLPYKTQYKEGFKK